MLPIHSLPQRRLRHSFAPPGMPASGPRRSAARARQQRRPRAARPIFSRSAELALGQQDDQDDDQQDCSDADVHGSSLGWTPSGLPPPTATEPPRRPLASARHDACPPDRSRAAPGARHRRAGDRVVGLRQRRSRRASRARTSPGRASKPCRRRRRPRGQAGLRRSASSGRSSPSASGCSGCHPSARRSSTSTRCCTSTSTACSSRSPAASASTTSARSSPRCTRTPPRTAPERPPPRVRQAVQGHARRLLRDLGRHVRARPHRLAEERRRQEAARLRQRARDQGPRRLRDQEERQHRHHVRRRQAEHRPDARRQAAQDANSGKGGCATGGKGKQPTSCIIGAD